MRKKEGYTRTFENLQRPRSNTEKTDAYIQRPISAANALYKYEGDSMECIGATAHS